MNISILFLGQTEQSSQVSTVVGDNNLRDEAFILLDEAQHKREKAAYHARKKDGLVAQHYAIEADRLREEAQRKQKKAAEIIFQNNNDKYRGKSVVDLHGLHVNEALQKLKNEIAHCKSKELQIITGRGKGSANRIRKWLISFKCKK